MSHLGPSPPEEGSLHKCNKFKMQNGLGGGGSRRDGGFFGILALLVRPRSPTLPVQPHLAQRNGQSA